MGVIVKFALLLLLANMAFAGYWEIDFDAHEREVFGSCKKTCEEGTPLHPAYRVKDEITKLNLCLGTSIKNCRKLRNGWNYWFVRCDYCRCTCVHDDNEYN